MKFHAEQTADNGDKPGTSSSSSAPQSVMNDQGRDRAEKSDTKPNTAQEVGEADMPSSEEGTTNQSLNIMEEGKAGTAAQVTVALDTEQGGGGNGGDRPSAFGGNDEDSMGSEEESGLSKRSAAQIASAAAAFGPEPSSSLSAQDARKPLRKSVSARRRSSLARKDSDERRRSSQIIAAQRRAEAQKAAAAAAGGGLSHANKSNHSTNSIQSATSSGMSKTKCEQNFQSEELLSKAECAPALPASAASSIADGPRSSADDQLGAPMSKEYQAVQSDSKRGMSMDSKQTTEITAPIESLAANRGSGGDEQQNERPKIGEGSGTTAALSDTGNGPLFPVKVDGSAMVGKTCLNTNYSLRRQLFLSFGTLSAVALMFVVLIAIITTSLAGNQVKYTS